MHRAFTFLAVVASAAAVPIYYLRDATCVGAKNVTQCEAAIAVCRNIFTSGSVAESRRNIFSECLRENGFDFDYVDSDILLGPSEGEALVVFGSEENHEEVKRCALLKRGLLRPDGTVNPDRTLEDLSFALNATRPDLLQRILNQSETCPLNDVDEWAICTLSACGYQEQATAVPTAHPPQEYIPPYLYRSHQG